MIFREYNGETILISGADRYIEDNKISSIIRNRQVNTIGGRAFYNNKNIETIDLRNSCVRNIETEAFAGCTNLKEVKLDSHVFINRGSFRDCVNLVSFDFNYIFNAIPSYAFANCKKLGKKIVISDSIYTIDSFAFSGCDNVYEISMVDSRDIISILDDAFAGLKNLEVFSIDTEYSKDVLSLKSVFNSFNKDVIVRLGEKGFMSLLNWQFIKNKTKRVDVDHRNKRFSSIDGVVFNKAKTVLMFYPPRRADKLYKIPDSVRIIHEEAFDKEMLSKDFKIISNNKIAIGEECIKQFMEVVRI